MSKRSIERKSWLSIQKIFLTKEELYDLYWNKKESMYKIAKICGITIQGIYYLMKRYNIPRRSIQEATKNNKPPSSPFKKGIYFGYGFKKGNIPWNAGKKRPEISGQKQWNWQNKKPKCIDCGKSLTVYNRKRCRKHFYEYYRGENTSNWKGGIAYLPYGPEFNKKLKRKIWERDNYICQLCKDVILTQTKNKFITVHHIDYNKLNNDEKNLISLCNFCNSSANTKREEWTRFFQNKINEVIYNDRINKI